MEEDNSDIPEVNFMHEVDSILCLRNYHVCEVDTTFGGGPFEGICLQASKEANMGAWCGFLPEGARWSDWFKAERDANRYVCHEMQDLVRLKRTTVEGRRSFKIPLPYLAVGGTVHI